MRRLHIGSDYEIVRDMTEWSATTGQHEPKTGLTLTGFLSATKTGATIHANLSKSLVEVGSTARYGAATSAVDHATYLTPLLTAAGKTELVIYERVTGTGYSDYEEVTISLSRQAGT